jgi:hypothetical protein
MVYCHRLASFDNACSLNGCGVGIGRTKQAAEASYPNSGDQRNDHDLQVCRAISAVNRIIHVSSYGPDHVRDDKLIAKINAPQIALIVLKRAFQVIQPKDLVCVTVNEQ